MTITALPLWKRCMAVGLSAALVLSFCPASALADELDGTRAAEGQEAVAPVADAATNAVQATADAQMAEAPASDNAVQPLADGPATGGSEGSGDATDPGNTGNTGAGDNTGAGAGINSGNTTTEKPAPEPKTPEINFVYKARAQGVSKWYRMKDKSKTTDSSGTVGKTTSTQGLTKMAISNSCKNIKGSITYKAYLAGKGWTKTAKNGKVIGNGKTKNAIQALRISLTGDLKKKYNIFYRVYVVGRGWTGWGKNGETVGAAKVSNIRAYQVKVIAKSDKKATKKYTKASARKNRTIKYSWETAQKYRMAAKAQSQSSRTKYLILTDISNCRVEILKGKKGDWRVYKYWKCTTGAPGSPTIRGKFVTTDRGLGFGHGYTCWYWTRICGDYLFHSVKYNPGSMTSIQDGRLGVHASMGCVRLHIRNAKWIYDNIPSNTKIWMY